MVMPLMVVLFTLLLFIIIVAMEFLIKYIISLITWPIHRFTTSTLPMHHIKAIITKSIAT